MVACSRTWLSGPVKIAPRQNSRLVLADEVVVEDEARGDRADRQHQQRDQHHQRALVRLVVVAVAVVVVRVVVVVRQRLGVGLELGVRGVVVVTRGRVRRGRASSCAQRAWPLKVKKARRQE